MTAGTENALQLRSYEDRGGGMRERFLTPLLDGARTFGVLSEPVDGRPSAAWVLCHSFGAEQDNLQSFEASLARRLAASGCLVFRFHAQGYGDSERAAEDISLASHVRAAVDAVELIEELADVSTAGLLGARFGGSVAVLAAQRLGGRDLALLQPVVRGRSYMQATIRSGLVATLSGDHAGGSNPRHAEDPLEAMRLTGVADVLGFPLRREVFGEISSLDLRSAAGPQGNRTLIVQISRSPEPTKDHLELAERFRDQGCACDVEVIQDADALRFGLPRFRADSGTTKSDQLATLSERVMRTVVPWCRALPDPAPKTVVAANGLAVEPSSAPWNERAIFVPVGRERVAAVLTVPEEPAGLVVLLQGLGAGRSHRNRVWTRTARALAEHGLASVRIDYPGLGDSTGRLPAGLDDPPVDAVAGVVDAATALVGIDRLGIIANCLGLRVGFILASTDPRYMGVVSILLGTAKPLLVGQGLGASGRTVKRLGRRLPRLKRLVHRAAPDAHVRPHLRLRPEVASVVRSRGGSFLFFGGPKYTDGFAPAVASVAGSNAPRVDVRCVPIVGTSGFRIPLDLQPMLIDYVVDRTVAVFGLSGPTVRADRLEVMRDG